MLFGRSFGGDMTVSNMLLLNSAVNNHPSNGGAALALWTVIMLIAVFIYMDVINSGSDKTLKAATIGISIFGALLIPFCIFITT
jgi:hypothetical protein